MLAAVGGERSALAAKRATSTIPIVFVTGDPVTAGLVESFNRPGGNVTGSVNPRSIELEPKRLGLLHELVPDVQLVGALFTNPNYPTAVKQLQDARRGRTDNRSAPFCGESQRQLQFLNAAFSSLLHQQVGSLLVTSDPYFDLRRDRIIAFAAQIDCLPCSTWREYAVAGGLVSYGPSVTEAYRNSGNFTVAFSRAPSLRICRSATHQIRVRHQPPDCESDRSRRSHQAARPRRQGGRVAIGTLFTAVRNLPQVAARKRPAGRPINVASLR